MSLILLLLFFIDLNLHRLQRPLVTVIYIYIHLGKYSINIILLPTKSLLFSYYLLLANNRYLGTYTNK